MSGGDTGANRFNSIPMYSILTKQLPPDLLLTRPRPLSLLLMFHHHSSQQGSFA
jgi:hypothetical protein